MMTIQIRKLGRKRERNPSCHVKVLMLFLLPRCIPGKFFLVVVVGGGIFLSPKIPFIFHPEVIISLSPARSNPFARCAQNIQVLLSFSVCGVMFLVPTSTISRGPIYTPHSGTLFTPTTMCSIWDAPHSSPQTSKQRHTPIM